MAFVSRNVAAARECRWPSGRHRQSFVSSLRGVPGATAPCDPRMRSAEGLLLPGGDGALEFLLSPSGPLAHLTAERRNWCE